jgi:hypothetical protein
MQACQVAPSAIHHHGLLAFLHDPSTLTAMGSIGNVLWITTYILIIRVGFRHRTYGVPLVALCLNFTWELYYTFLSPPRCVNGTLDRWTLAAFVVWLALDAVIMFQLLRYGRDKQTIPEIRKFFYPVVLLTAALALLGFMTTDTSLREIAGATASGTAAAYIINFVMSVLFVFFYFGRRDLDGISYWAAWTKLLATGIISLANVLSYEGDYRGRQFYLLLFVSILLFDSCYVYLVHRARQGRPLAS